MLLLELIEINSGRERKELQFSEKLILFHVFRKNLFKFHFSWDYYAVKLDNYSTKKDNYSAKKDNCSAKKNHYSARKENYSAEKDNYFT